MLTGRWKMRIGLFLAGMVLVNGTLAWKSRGLISEGYPDFTIFYCAARILRSGQGEHLYDLATQLRVQREFASEKRTRYGPLPYNHPPFEAALFLPLGSLPYLVAFRVWAGINFGILVALYYLLRPRFPGLARFSLGTWLLFCLAFFPVYVVLLQGQDVLLFVLLLAGALVALQRDSDWAAGVWLGLGLFRFHLLVPVVLGLLFQRRLRAIASFFLTGVVLFGLSIQLVGVGTTLSYTKYVRQIENDMLLRKTVLLSNMTNLRGLLDTVPPVAPKRAADALAIFLSVGLALYAAGTWKKTPELAFNMGFAVCLIAALLSAYHALIHDSSVLILASVVVADYALSRGSMNRSGLLLMLPTFIFLFSPLQALLWYHRGQGAVIATTLIFWLWRIRVTELDSLRDATSRAFVPSSTRTDG